MKILMWHAKNLRIEAGVGRKKTSKRKRALKRLKSRLGDSLPALDESGGITTAENALLVLSCIEKGDERLQLGPVKDSIIKSRAMLGVTEIVIAAFGHLSDRPADPMLASRIVDELFEMVRAEHEQAKLVPFGWDKSLEMKVPLHHYNCGFLSFD
jgi:hypothetical protein